jgi:hypothetical protein
MHVFGQEDDTRLLVINFLTRYLFGFGFDDIGQAVDDALVRFDLEPHDAAHLSNE